MSALREWKEILLEYVDRCLNLRVFDNISRIGIIVFHHWKKVLSGIVFIPYKLNTGVVLFLMLIFQLFAHKPLVSISVKVQKQSMLNAAFWI